MTKAEEKLVIEYAERFDDGVPFAYFANEKDFMNAIRAALDTNTPIPDSPDEITV